MEKNLRNKYEQFVALTGTVSERLAAVGYPPSLGSTAQVSCFEEFQGLLTPVSQMDKTEIEKWLKKGFGSYLNRADLKHLLKNGNDGLTDGEIENAYNVLPVDEEYGILLHEFIDALYQ